MTARIIRILCDMAAAASAPPNAPTDPATNMPVTAWRKEALQIDVGAFADYSAGTVATVTGWTNVKLEIFGDGTRRMPALVTKTDTALDPDTMAKATWDDGTEETASFDLADTDLDIDCLGQATRDLWMVITATDSGGTRILKAGTLTLHESGRE
jgi:hypothetical protein